MKNINGKGFWVIWVHIATGYNHKMGDATQNISMKVLFVPQYVKWIRDPLLESLPALSLLKLRACDPHETYHN